MGGISHLGGISPPCPYMASVNGCPMNNIIFIDSLHIIDWNYDICCCWILDIQLQEKAKNIPASAMGWNSESKTEQHKTVLA